MALSNDGGSPSLEAVGQWPMLEKVLPPVEYKELFNFLRLADVLVCPITKTFSTQYGLVSKVSSEISTLSSSAMVLIIFRSNELFILNNVSNF